MSYYEEDVCCCRCDEPIYGDIIYVYEQTEPYCYDCMAKERNMDDYGEFHDEDVYGDWKEKSYGEYIHDEEERLDSLNGDFEYECRRDMMM